MQRHNKVVPLNEGKIRKKVRSAVDIQDQSSSTSIVKKSKLKNIQTKQQVKQARQQVISTCRICLQDGEVLHASNKSELDIQNSKLTQQKQRIPPLASFLISTCKCQGTSGYVHQQCIIQWIDTQIKRQKDKHIKCQICLEEIIYDRKTIKYFYWDFDGLYRVRPWTFLFSVIIIVLMVIFVGVSVMADQIGISSVVRTTIYVLIAILVFSLVMLLLVIFKQAFYKKRKQTTKVYSLEERKLLGLRTQLSHYQQPSSTNRTNISNHIRQIPSQSLAYHSNNLSIRSPNYPSNRNHRSARMIRNNQLSHTDVLQNQQRIDNEGSRRSARQRRQARQASQARQGMQIREQDRSRNSQRTISIRIRQTTNIQQDI